MEIKGFGPLELILGRQDSHFRTWPSQMTLIRAIKPKGDLIASVQSVSYSCLPNKRTVPIKRT